MLAHQITWFHLLGGLCSLSPRFPVFLSALHVKERWNLKRLISRKKTPLSWLKAWIYSATEKGSCYALTIKKNLPIFWGFFFFHFTHHCLHTYITLLSIPFWTVNFRLLSAGSFTIDLQNVLPIDPYAIIIISNIPQTLSTKLLRKGGISADIKHWLSSLSCSNPLNLQTPTRPISLPRSAFALPCPANA